MTVTLAAEPATLSPSLEQFIRHAPKAELHVHIEGTLEPELAFALAERNGVKLAYDSPEALRAAYDFHDLQSFLDLYYAGASALCTAEDFYELAMAYFARAAADRVVRAEIFFDPQTHTDRGVPFGAVMDGLTTACREAGRRYGVNAALIMCFLRHLSEQSAFATLESALPYRDEIIGVGLDSSELGNPPEKFSRLFRQCGKLGLRRVAHAGEEGPPEYIRAALDELGAERIDHGVRCLEDPALVARLHAERIPLTVCPLSNVKLKVFDDLAQHNLPRLLDLGLVVTVNSDDPAYFGGYLNDNLLALFRACPSLNVDHAHELARHSLRASFADASSKRAWLGELAALRG